MVAFHKLPVFDASLDDDHHTSFSRGTLRCIYYTGYLKIEISFFLVCVIGIPVRNGQSTSIRRRSEGRKDRSLGLGRRFFFLKVRPHCDEIVPWTSFRDVGLTSEWRKIFRLPLFCNKNDSCLEETLITTQFDTRRHSKQGKRKK